MGRLFRKTTAFFTDPSIAERLRKVFTPCLPGNRNKLINVKIFDANSLAQNMNTSGSDLVTELESFLNGMRNAPGLDLRVVAKLALITFKVTYTTTPPTSAEVKGFGTNDFPIYLLAVTGSFAVSGAHIEDLLVAHRISERTFVGVKGPTPEAPLLSNVFPYKDIVKDWDEKDSILGFGIPGTYFVPHSQTICRKVGIIKMEGTMRLNLHFSLWKKKLLSVLKHEIGHMLGLKHENGTLMAESYDINFNFDAYTNNQLEVVGRGLELLTQ